MYYVYEHWRPDKDICFYVGKGKGSRANSMKGRNKYHRAVQKKLHSLGMCVEVKIVKSGLSEEESFQIEKKQINFWKSNNVKLANLTNGGEGTAGLKHSKKSREKMSKDRIGRKLSEETKKKVSEASKKRWLNEEYSNKMKLLAKNNNYFGGKVHSDETRQKISAANFARWKKIKELKNVNA